MVFIRPYQESDFEACAHIASQPRPAPSSPDLSHCLPASTAPSLNQIAHCRATLPPSLSTTPITAKLAPYIWTHQYTHLSPGTCHMLVDDDDDDDSSPSDPSSTPGGKVVGYCIGTPDVYAFADRYPSYTTSVLSTAVAPPPPLPSGEEGEESFWIPNDTTLTPSGTAPLQSKKPNPAALIRLAHDPRKLLQLDDASGLPAQGWRATMHIDLLPAYQRRGWGRRLIDAYLQSVRASGEDCGQGAWIGIAPDNAGVVQFYDKVGFRLVTPSSAVEGQAKDMDDGEDGIHMVIDIARD